MKKLILLIAVISLISATSCLNRQLVRVTDHPQKALTMVETTDTYAYRAYIRAIIGIFSSEAANKYPVTFYRFWSCQDTGSDLNCNVECDGTTDLDCIGW
jgi:hypothetical protein